MGCGASSPAPPGRGSLKSPQSSTATGTVDSPLLTLSPQERKNVFQPGREACNEDIEDDLYSSPSQSFSMHKKQGAGKSSAHNIANIKMAPFANASLAVDLVDAGSYASATQARLLRYYMKRDLASAAEQGDVRATRKLRAQSLQDDLDAPLNELLADHARVRDAYDLVSSAQAEELAASSAARGSIAGLNPRDSARASLPGAPGAMRASRSNRFPSMPVPDADAASFKDATSVTFTQGHASNDSSHGDGESFSTKQLPASSGGSVVAAIASSGGIDG